jgi:small subunit ribosomal protein S11
VCGGQRRKEGEWPQLAPIASTFHLHASTTTMSALTRLVRAGPSTRTLAVGHLQSSTRSFATSSRLSANDDKYLSSTPPALDSATPFEGDFASGQENSYNNRPAYDSQPAMTGPPSAPASGYGLPSTKGANPLRSTLPRVQLFGTDKSSNTSIDKEYNTSPVQWIINVRCTSNNAHMSLAKANGEFFRNSVFSGGACGFKGANRNGYEAGYQCASRLFKRVDEAMQAHYESEEARRNIDIKVIFKGFGKGRDAFLSALTMSEGEKIRTLVKTLVDATPIKIGGTRSKKMKRR